MAARRPPPRSPAAKLFNLKDTDAAPRPLAAISNNRPAPQNPRAAVRPNAKPRDHIAAAHSLAESRAFNTPSDSAVVKAPQKSSVVEIVRGKFDNAFTRPMYTFLAGLENWKGQVVEVLRMWLGFTWGEP
ncbi:hypothetical protein HK101_011791, partial [Irineochytrium annulatum]